MINNHNDHEQKNEREVVCEYCLAYGREKRTIPKISINNAETAAKLSKSLINEPQETVRALFLDQQNCLVGWSDVFRGSVDCCDMNPRELLRMALLTPNCTGVILAHQHCSGNPTPSQQDKNIADRTEKAFDVVGLRFLDFIVVGEEGWVSRADCWRVNSWK